MRKLFLALVAIGAAFSARADISPQEIQYAQDREKAIRQFNAALRDRCLQDFSQKWKRSVKPLGQAAYSDAISRQVYTLVFWNHSDRGVAFTLPVEAKSTDGHFQGDIACFYAVDDKKLHFQLSQQVYRRF